MTDHPRKQPTSPGEKLWSGTTDGFTSVPSVVLTSRMLGAGGLPLALNLGRRGPRGARRAIG
jgi:hypothetical protein